MSDDLFAQEIPGPAIIVKPVKEPMALLLNGKWYSAGKMLWDCSDCVCLDCANNGKSCHDCGGFEVCIEHKGRNRVYTRVDLCPDYRKEVTP